MDLTERVPFWLQKRCRAYALLLQYEYTASYAVVGTGWGFLSCFAFFFLFSRILELFLNCEL